MKRVLVAMLLAYPVFAAAAHAQGSTVFSDDFSRDRLYDASRYARFGQERFRVRAGTLSVDMAGEDPFAMDRLLLLPPFGESSWLSFRARWTGGEGATLTVIADCRYKTVGRRLPFYLYLNEGAVYCWASGSLERAEAPFRKGSWSTVRFDRDGSSVRLSVDGRQVMDIPLGDLDPVHDEASDDAWAGWALETDTRPYRQAYEIDDLKAGGDRSPLEWKAWSEEFSVEADGRDLPLRFTVLARAAHESWARAQLSGSIAYLRTCAQIMGTAPLARNLGLIDSRGAYFSQNAAYNSSGMVLQTPVDANAEWPSTHELAHNWQQLYGEGWITEGSADLCMILYREVEGRGLVTARDFLFDRGTHTDRELQKGGESFFFAEEGAGRDFFDEGMPQWDIIHTRAWKQRVFTYALYRFLGPEGFRELHRRAADSGVKLGRESIIELGSEILGSDLGAYFPGWAVRGRAALPPAGLFSDKDEDGLSDLDEALLGTDPRSADSDGDGAGDLGELAAGHDPRQADGWVDAAPIVDGLAADWEGAEELARDGRDGGRMEDLAWLKARLEPASGGLFVAVGFHGEEKRAAATDWETWLTFDIDGDADGLADYRVNLFTRMATQNAFRTNGFSGASWDSTRWTALDASGVRFFRKGAFLEAFLPAAVMGRDSGGGLSLWVISGAEGRQDDFGDWAATGD